MSFTGITVLKSFLEQGDLRTVHSTTCLFREMCLTQVDVRTVLLLYTDLFTFKLKCLQTQVQVPYN